jgi:hypothetical protein
MDVLVEEHFYRTSHQKIFRTMAELSDVGEVIDQITLTARLKAQGQLESIGGAAYIAELWHEVPSAANVSSHAQIVRDHADRRRAIADARRVTDAAYSEAPLAELVDYIDRLLVPLGSGSVSAPADSPIGTFSPMSASQLLDDPEPIQPTWVWEEFLPEGGLAGLIAKPKVGKTTNTYELAVKVAQGLPYLGRATRCGAVLILALEEHRREVKRRLIHLGADQIEAIHLHVGPLADSPETFQQLKQYIGQHGIVLVILDTLNSFWSVQEENDAVDVTQVLKPLLALARESGAAVLLLHHARKSEGEHGDEIRGSGALFSLLDIALILKRHDIENQRKLTAISRYPETPPELIIELREHGHEALGDPSTVGKAAKMAKVRAALTDTPEPAQEIARRTGVSRGSTYTILDGLVTQGEALRSGSGRRGDAFLYSRFVSVSPLRSVGPNETNPPTSPNDHEASSPGGCVSFHPPILEGELKRNETEKDGFVSFKGDGGQTKRNEGEGEEGCHEPEQLFVEEVISDDN